MILRQEDFDQPEKTYFEKEWEKIKSDRLKLATCIVSVTLFTIGYFILAAHLITHAYSNGDPKSCYYMMGLDQVNANP